MPTYEASISIAAEPAAVWRVLSDVAAWPAWLPTVDAVQPLDDAAVRPGARFAVRQPKLRPATWTVTQLDPAGRFEWVARSPGLRMTGDHVVTPESPGGARVVLRFGFSGLLGGLVGKLYGPLVRDYIAQEAQALKRKLESRGN
jgi:uncharacterized membrane protein